MTKQNLIQRLFGRTEEQTTRQVYHSIVKKLNLFASEQVKKAELAYLKADGRVEICKPEKCYNSRYQYTETFGGGITFNGCKSEDMRYGSQKRYNNNKIKYFIETVPKGTFSVKSEKLHKTIEADTILRLIIDGTFGSYSRNYYFLNGKDTKFSRDFTPSMYDDKEPDDSFEDYRYLYNADRKSDDARPLIHAMELTLGKEPIAPRYLHK